MNSGRGFFTGAGFTLFEVVISLSLLLIIVGSLSGFVISIQNARTSLSSMQEVESNMSFALSLMRSRIRNARGVNVPSSTFNTDPGVLSLDMADAVVNPTVFRLDQDDGLLLMQEGAAAPIAVTTPAVSFSRLIFSLRSPAEEPDNIGIDITINAFSSSDSYASFSHSATTAVTTRH